ncbi:oxidoreductase, molybdopterin binding [Luminiphilus syltensis NOR5-1B]|uniref:Oxidoreductase, molybdopterin binding n=1 Tax=Luminiphilus syltensis NOR5-1B TaxID=565045 RepID=B8KQI4_9GAMM|nr:oxidoreductase, molybdopterin binding [Luminiphilus syltensis NOR5-1B]
MSNKVKKKVPAIASSEITPESDYLNRRQLIRRAGIGAAGLMLPGASSVMANDGLRTLDFVPGSRQSAPFTTDEPMTPFEAVTGYNNFYEFGTDKTDPARYAREMTVDPWSIEVGGLVQKPGKLNLEDVLGSFDLEERIYRLRCVEAWSMVIPWIGFPLSDLLARFEPKSEGRYVEFKTLHRRGEMRGTRSFTAVIDWPYREGLRMDEAMHPLTLMAVGLYGKTLPNQNGAPLRLVVPWKYDSRVLSRLFPSRW